MPELNHNLRFAGMLLLLIPAASLFFLGGLSDISLPSIRYLWNMGHVAFFALLTYAIGYKRPWSSTLQVFAYLGIILLVSLVIEFIQRLIGRDFSTMDVLRNLIGCTLTLVLTSRKFVHISVISFLSFIFVIDLTGLVVTTWTDVTIQTRAPLIDDFESEFILARWQGDLERSNEHVLTGQSSAHVRFPTGSKYAGVKFGELLRNWQGYQTLVLNIFNPQSTDETITLRLHDALHEGSEQQAYGDRFNTQLALSPGWNEIRVPLSDIASAPSTRKMDLTRMIALGIFFTDLSSPKELYFDDFYLQR